MNKIKLSKSMNKKMIKNVNKNRYNYQKIINKNKNLKMIWIIFWMNIKLEIKNMKRINSKKMKK